MRKTKDVLIWLANSNSARDFVVSSICCCFYIIYSLSIIFTNACRWLGGWCVGCVSLGPGFESQVHPKPLFVIFLHLITCRFQRQVHHMPPIIQAPCGCQHRSNGQEMKNTIFPVNHAHGGSPKSNRLVR